MNLNFASYLTNRIIKLRVLILILLCVSVIEVSVLATSNPLMASNAAEKRCSADVTVEKPNWSVLANVYGTSDLVVYSLHMVVFNLTALQVDVLKTAHQVELSQSPDGAWQVCGSR